MKKTKIMLTAIAVVAVVGGAFAFSARQNTVIYTIDPLKPAKGCTVPVSFRTLDPIGSPVAHTFASTTTTATCQALDIYVNQ